jgi:hypothetical protein
LLGRIKTRNEARAEQGLAGLPDGADLLVPANMETVDQPQQGSARANAESAAAVAAQEMPAMRAGDMPAAPGSTRHRGQEGRA